MNDDLELDQRQLEAATSRALPADATLDSETSALREGFLALGRAVETAAADYDEAALIGRLQASCADESHDVVAKSHRSTRLWQFALSGVLAASLLVAIARIITSWPVEPVVAELPTAPKANQVAEAAASPNDTVGQEELPTSSTVAWDDPLDQEIVAAQSSLADLGGAPAGIDGALSNVNQTLEALADDLSGESL